MLFRPIKMNVNQARRERSFFGVSDGNGELKRAMHHNHEGLTLWYGTDDAHAPEGVVDLDQKLYVVAGVSPANPSNTVTLHYRIDNGFERLARAELCETEYANGRQYFKAFFREEHLSPGSKVDYTVIFQSGGRQVPNPSEGTDFHRHFFVQKASRPQKAEPASHRNLSEGRLPFRIEYLSHLTIHLGEGPPEIIGETPEGIKVNWYISSGEVSGPKLNGKIRAVGGDWMTIRPDGIGVMDVRATIETTDGALIYISYLGYFELGEEGYQNFLQKKWPPTPPTRTTPRMSTAHPKYLWVNRLQCFGIGRVIMKIPKYEYDLYGLF